jgi:nitrate/nitrite-specific signal transduction histidine kinase
MGLRIMQYRAGMLGGTLSVEPNSNGGTSVICSVPAVGIK